MKKPRYFQKIIDRIKFLSSGQKALKAARKTTSEDYHPEASGKHFSNRFELRHLHICYDTLRGREKIVYPKKAYFHTPTLEKLMMKYDPVPVPMELNE
jgi:hypothetical protein